MRNIIKADFYKLKNSKPFWICLALSLLFGIIIMVGLQQAMVMAQQPRHDPDLDALLDMIPHASGAYLLSSSMSYGFHIIFIGVFVAVFISSEFSFGTMKNTLSRGAGRIKVFFSKFLVCSAAALTMLFGFILTSLLTGSIIWGFDPHGIVTASGMISMLLMQALLTVAFTALFTFVSMTMRSNGGAIAVNIMCVTMASTLLGAISMLLFGGRFDLSHYWIGGAISKLATVTPVSGDIIQGIFIALIWGIASMIFGTTLFKKLDVK